MLASVVTLVLDLFGAMLVYCLSNVSSSFGSKLTPVLDLCKFRYRSNVCSNVNPIVMLALI